MFKLSDFIPSRAALALALFATLGVFAFVFGGQAIAADAAAGSKVSIPIGDWATAILDVLNDLVLPLVVVVVGWAMRVLPSSIAAYLKMMQVDQLLARAVGYGISAVRGAVAGKELTADVGNEVLAEAIRYALAHAPALVEWAGGADALREKIVARLNLEATVGFDAKAGALRAS